MKALTVVILSLAFSYHVRAQFTQIPLGTSTDIYGVTVNPYGCLLRGLNDYIAKSDTDCNVFTQLTTPGPPYYNNYQLRSTDSSNLYCLIGTFSPFNFRIYKSTDAGLSWNLKFDTTVVYFVLNMLDSLNGFAVGYGGRMLRTEDAGETWQIDSMGSQYISPLSSKSLNSTVCVSGFQFLATSQDAAFTWTEYSFAFQAYTGGVYILNSDTIMASGYFGNDATSDTRSYFFKTTNGGVSWSHNLISTGTNALGTRFNYSGEGYIVGVRYADTTGVIWKTTDFGETWSEWHTGYPAMFYEIEFVNDSIALIGGSSGTLLRWNKNDFATGTDLAPITDASCLVYPTPVIDKLYVRIPEPTSSLSVYDLSGKQLMSLTVDNGAVDVRQLKPGCYVLEARGKSFHCRTRFVKQ